MIQQITDALLQIVSKHGASRKQMNLKTNTGNQLKIKPMNNTETTNTIAVLNRFEVTKQELEIFIADYSNLVLTPETFEAAKKARQIIREKRFKIQERQTSNDSERIAWNKHLAAQNKQNAEELINVILPVEERIDVFIKQIEAQKEKEKAERLAALRKKFEDRKAMILETGAVYSEEGKVFTIGEAVIDPHSIESMEDPSFEFVMIAFKAAASVLKAKQEAEKAAEEKAAAEKAEAERLAEIERKEITAAQEATRIEQERKQAELNQQQAEIERQQNELKQKEAETKQRIVEFRKQQVINKGMTIVDSLIHYKNEVLLSWLFLADSTEEDWSDAMHTAEVNIKRIDAEIAEAEEEQRKAEEEKNAKTAEEKAAFIEAIRPEKQALLDFCLNLQNVDVPSFKHEFTRKVLLEMCWKIDDAIKEAIEKLD